MAHHAKAISISNFQFDAQRVCWAVFTGFLALIAVLVFGEFGLIQAKQAAQPVYEAHPYSDDYAGAENLRPPVFGTAAELKRHRDATKDLDKAIKADRKTVEDIVESNGGFGDAIVAKFFNGYLFPSMTDPAPEVISKLGETRTEFLKDFLGRDVNGNRASMINATITGMKKIYEDNKLHPASRLNAVYLIGMLDDVYPDRRLSRIPKPSKAAFAELARILTSADANVAPDYLKVAALAGLQRHVEIDHLAGNQIDAASKQALFQQLLTFLNKPETDDLSYWLKRRSMQMAGMLGDPRTLDIAIATLNKKDAELWLQFDAIQSIGKLNMSAVGAEKNLEAAVAISEFMGQALKNESTTLKAKLDQLVFDGMLFSNIDLEKYPVDYQADASAATGAAASAGSGGSGGGAGGPGGGGGLGQGGEAGAGGPDGPPGGPGGGEGLRSATTGPIKLELPGFQLNVMRRRVKSLAFTSSRVLGGEDGKAGLIKNISDPAGKTFVENVIVELNGVVKDSSTGIVDLSDPPKAPTPGSDPPPPITEQLVTLSEKSGTRLSQMVSEQKGEPADDPTAAPTDPAPTDPAPADPTAAPKSGDQ